MKAWGLLFYGPLSIQHQRSVSPSVQTTLMLALHETKLTTSLLVARFNFSFSDSDAAHKLYGHVFIMGQRHFGDSGVTPIPP